MNVTNVTSEGVASYPMTCVKVVSEVKAQGQYSRRGSSGVEESDFGALLYIVVVLVFYSMGKLSIVIR